MICKQSKSILKIFGEFWRQKIFKKVFTILLLFNYQAFVTAGEVQNNAGMQDRLAFRASVLSAHSQES